tara:strand:+ start:303 stop:2702 length:2400 start_codon:yes stop_codon:yes gene_type:complete
MGFLSSLFGSKSSTPATTTQITTSKLPPEIAPQVEEIAKEAKRLYDERIAEGYVPYEGATIAPFTPDELSAQEGIRGLVGTAAPLQQEALGITRQGGERFTGDVAQEYMNPYQQAVIDIEKREAQEDFEGRILPAFEAQAVGAGGMSGLGSRAGVQAALLGESQAKRLGDIQAKGLRDAYTKAQQDFTAQKIRERQQAQDLERLGPAMFASGIAEQGALQQIGEQRRDLAQESLDEAYFRFLEERSEPQAALAQYSGTVFANPLTGMPTTSQTGTQRAAAPSTGSQLLGLGLQAANIYGMGGGFNPGGFSMGNLFKTSAEGGKVEEGLSGVVYRQAGSAVGVPDMGLGPVPKEEAEKITSQLDAALAREDAKSVLPSNEIDLAGIAGIARGPARGDAGRIFEKLVMERGLPSQLLETPEQLRKRLEDNRSAIELQQGRTAFDREAALMKDRKAIDDLSKQRYDESRKALEQISFGETLGSQLLTNIGASLVNPNNTIATSLIKGAGEASKKFTANQKEKRKALNQLNDARSTAELARLEKRSAEDISAFDKIALQKQELLLQTQKDETSIIGQEALRQAADIKSIGDLATVSNTLAKAYIDKLSAEASLAKSKGDKTKNRQTALDSIRDDIYRLAGYKLIDGQWNEDPKTTIKGLSKNMLLKVITDVQRKFNDSIEQGDFKNLAEAQVDARSGAGSAFDVANFRAISRGEVKGLKPTKTTGEGNDKVTTLGDREYLPTLENIPQNMLEKTLALYRTENQAGRKAIAETLVTASGGAITNSVAIDRMQEIIRKALRRANR